MQSGKFHSHNPPSHSYMLLIFALRICVESYTERPIHTAEEKILSYIEHLAPDMPLVIVGTKTDKFLKFENTEDDPKSQHEIIQTQIEAFRRIYEEKVQNIELKFVFVSQGKYRTLSRGSAS